MYINQLKNTLRFDNVPLQTISVKEKSRNHDISILRLDMLHPQVSGNKWFKLQYYLDGFFRSGKGVLATFGGAYSNHIAATAAACQLLEIPCVGWIRGEEPAQYSPTLERAVHQGMQLRFVERTAYRNKEKIMSENPDYYWIPEGGYGHLGMLGAADIWNYVSQKETYSHVFLAVGSGTTTAGILHGATIGQHIMGVSVMKNNLSLEKEIAALASPSEMSQLQLLHGFHFGGYAQKNDELLAFMHDMWQQYRIPLDFVYTAKAFYALMQEAREGNFSEKNKVLFIHTGGLQGNQSLSREGK
ncbi:MAG: pyridoxal-phosphate dependent enzyme [Chitinophagaceae bacterium]